MSNFPATIGYIGGMLIVGVIILGVTTYRANTPTVSDRFAVDFLAHEFAQDKGITRLTCEAKRGMLTSTCWGLVGNGPIVVEFECDVKSDKCWLGEI